MDWEVATCKGLMHLGCVLNAARTPTPMQSFEAAAAALADSHGIRADALVKRLALREGRGSTAIGRGVAIPHADSWGIRKAQAAYVRSDVPVGFFPTKDDEPVHDVLVLIAPRPATAMHQRMLAHYRALMGDAAFLAQLRSTEEPLAIWRLFREREWHG